MKKILSSLIILILFSFTMENKVPKIGKLIPNYTFKEILNVDQKSFSLENNRKAIIIEFWATWCSPCLPAMKKLEQLQEEFNDEIEIITVSTDSKKNLNRYIANTKTSLRVAFDTSHLKTFNYQYIPHTILIDKDGIVQAITTPGRITSEVISKLIAGKAINLTENENDIIAPDFNLNKEFKNNNFRYKLTSENKNLNFKSEIKKNDNNEPVSIEFNNVSIHRLLTDIYELSSVARIYNRDVVSSNKKYCFSLEQNSDYAKGILQHAKEILNENSDVKAELVEKEMDSIYVLKIIDNTKLPQKSTEPKKQIKHRGPSFLGKKISSYNLAEYIENEAFQAVIDKTELNYTFDIELNWNYENPKTLNQELKKYGLQISRSEKPEKITLLVLTKK